ncbi:MAG TPA: GNAT family N-acetyltransferase [Solirubrobacteraceae bacterium]|nr:GNAT family N-acetyltransferase [Solirubrobacteraceae bacterium]
MTPSGAEGLRFRPAEPGDAPAVAALHADSWRRHYRGAYADRFLDGDVHGDRLAVWTKRLSAAHPDRCTILAEGPALVGFANTYFDEDPQWGALLDNVHVAAARKRQGIGSRLLALTAAAVLERPAPTGLYLWVLEQNTAAQAFYGARGGRCVERAPVTPPGGVEDRLVGSPRKLRYVWPEPRVLAVKGETEKL